MITSGEFDPHLLLTVSSAEAKSSPTKIKCKYDNNAETVVTEWLTTENKDFY